MKRIFTATIAVAAIALAGAMPALATTFPTLTQIYVASGATENNNSAASGVSTVIFCSNLSGQTASVRFQFRDPSGTLLAGGTLAVANLAAKTVYSQGLLLYANGIELPTGHVFGGTIHIFSTQSAVFCSAMLVHAGGSNTGPAGAALHMVRFNPHPGTVE